MRDMEIKLHTFLSLALEGSKWSVSHSSNFTIGEGPLYPWNKRICEAWSYRLGTEKDPCLESNLWSSFPEATLLTDL
jgi:hypothetical protein